MKDPGFLAQVELLIRVLPFLADEEIFALKGGTAINLFVRDMPRLSVDIDLTYLPIKGREESLKEIGTSITRAKRKIEAGLKGSTVTPLTVKGMGAPTSYIVRTNEAEIKTEINFVLRGNVYPVVTYELCAAVQEKFGTVLQMTTLSPADLYGGKLCAALDRQHPRDLFDIKLLLENEGFTETVRTAFVVYLASHSRPMNELLNPTWKDISRIFETDFQGMSTIPVSLAELLSVRDQMLALIRRSLTEADKQFLLSMKRAEPDWSLIDVKGIERLPGLQWKLTNVKKMDRRKREEALDKLKAVLYPT